jgi:hypothetical protein
MALGRGVVRGGDPVVAGASSRSAALLRLEHPPHLRIERVAAHRFLWFAWGNAEAAVPRDETTLAFGTNRDQAFRALFHRLERNTPREEDFVV